MFTQDPLDTSRKRSLLDGKVFPTLKPAGFIPSPQLAGSELSTTSRDGSPPAMPKIVKSQSQVEQKSTITHVSHPSVVPSPCVDSRGKLETLVLPKNQIIKANSTLLTHSKYETVGIHIVFQLLMLILVS